MSILTSLGIIFLAMLIHCFFQLSPSVLTIFYHYASGKNSARKADGLAIYFILGAEIFLATIFLIIYCAFYYIFINTGRPAGTVLPWILAGVFFALSILSFVLYFRRSNGTELFISRGLAKRITTSAQEVKTTSDAFVLGFITCIPELVFTLPLFIATALSLTYITNFPRSIFILIYIVVVIFPLFVYHHMYRIGHNLAEIQRRRVKNKSFYRFIISVGFLTLAIIMLNVGLGNG